MNVQFQLLQKNYLGWVITETNYCVTVELLGCYRIVDVRRQTITSAEGSSHWLGIEADNRDLKVIVCAAVAYERGMKIFAIQVNC